MINFFKGIIVGIGGITPGLSGSVLLVILGLYKKTLDSIGALFTDFKRNFSFLFPLFLGFGTGIFLFGKIINYLLSYYETYTRFTFLGLILGTIPIFYKEVKKNCFDKKFYFLILFSFILGVKLFLHNNLFPTIYDPTLFQSFLLGIIVAISTTIPGLDGAVVLSTLGLYKIYVNSIANIDINILIPAGLGLILGVLIISKIMNKLIDKYYTLTFSIIFGLFLSLIPNILTQNCSFSFSFQSFFYIIFLLIGFFISSFLSKLNSNNKI